MEIRNNSYLEDLHSGKSPITKTGDYSDVKVVTPDGEIMWNEISRINDKEMRSLMLSVEQTLETTLGAFERLSRQQKEGFLEMTLKQRTYDEKR